MRAITIDSDFLKTKQQIHGIGNALLPLVGTLSALTLAFWIPVTGLDLTLLGVMYFLTMIGITVGFHRHFAHAAFQTHRVMRVIFAVLGSMAAQGPLIYWVATHRRHHKYSDHAGDPHSPFVKEDEHFGFWQGLWHSHVAWTFNHKITNTFLFARDMLGDPLLSRISNLYFFWIALGLVVPGVIGGVLTHSWIGALTGFLWGGCVRTFLSHHIGFWTIGSVAHLWGNRPYETDDFSRNNLWFALPTGGEMWHNNHHAFPSSAFFGLEWWQIDIGGWVIQLMAWLRLAWDLKVPSMAQREAKKRKPDPVVQAQS